MSTKTIEVPVFETPEGAPTCASDFRKGMFCQFLFTTCCGTKHHCFFAQSGRAILDATDNGKGFLIPCQECPLHARGEEAARPDKDVRDLLRELAETVATKGDSMPTGGRFFDKARWRKICEMVQDARKILGAPAWLLEKAEQKTGEASAETRCPAVFTGQGGYDNENKRANSLFEVGKTYQITGGSVGQSQTTLELEGFGGGWNSVLFDFDWNKAPLDSPYLRSKSKKPPTPSQAPQRPYPNLWRKLDFYAMRVTRCVRNGHEYYRAVVQPSCGPASGESFETVAASPVECLDKMESALQQFHYGSPEEKP